MATAGVTCIWAMIGPALAPSPTPINRAITDHRRMVGTASSIRAAATAVATPGMPPIERSISTAGTTMACHIVANISGRTLPRLFSRVCSLWGRELNNAAVTAGTDQALRGTDGRMSRRRWRYWLALLAWDCRASVLTRVTPGLRRRMQGTHTAETHAAGASHSIAHRARFRRTKRPTPQKKTSAHIFGSWLRLSSWNAVPMPPAMASPGRRTSMTYPTAILAGVALQHPAEELHSCAPGAVLATLARTVTSTTNGA
jgi:hypothetical protein